MLTLGDFYSADPALGISPTYFVWRILEGDSWPAGKFHSKSTKVNMSNTLDSLNLLLKSISLERPKMDRGHGRLVTFVEREEETKK